jgi:hypothetical protein
MDAAVRENEWGCDSHIAFPTEIVGNELNDAELLVTAKTVFAADEGQLREKNAGRFRYNDTIS